MTGPTLSMTGVLAPLAIFGQPVRGRSCGSCTACCTVVPVDLPTGHKAAGERCSCLRSTGCGVYARRPEPCRAWSCRWLFDDHTAELRRPDKVGYIIDPMPDTILIDRHKLSVLQVWCSTPDAHRDPALRTYLDGVGRRHGIPAFVRFGSRDGFLLIPPCMASDGEWHEMTGNMQEKDDMARMLREAV